MSDMKNKLTAFITRSLTELVESKGLTLTVELHMDMFATDLLDSLQFLTLITQLEDEFGLDIDFSEFEPEEFRTIHGFVDCLTR